MTDRDLGAIGVCIAAMTSVACGGQAWLQEDGHAEAWNGLGAHESRADWGHPATVWFKYPKPPSVLFPFLTPKFSSNFQMIPEFIYFSPSELAMLV